MTKITLEQKLAIKAGGFLTPFISYGGWGIMTVVSTLLSIITGVITNCLNISNSAQTAPAKVQGPQTMVMPELMKMSCKLFNNF
ncbi:hypothetical protein [Ureaplasma ceti]|uniref:Uncharacterized protein n=1 Tax=Ureaplasma ceti TaxID=3119530 RepID=A0ABP9U655_9BACT